MRTKTIKIFKLSELSEKAKETAHENWLRNWENTWADENRETLEAFAKVFPVTITDWSYGGRGEGVGFRMDVDEEVEELRGQRLANYIWNNYRNELFKGKYYRHVEPRNEPIAHPKLTRSKLSGGPNKGKYFQAYHGITLEHSCVLTGYCMDDVILGPVYEFLDKPDEAVTFRELLENCFDKWVRACNEDSENAQSMETFEADAEANEWEFDQYGNME
jgi:hypothetical protein